MAAGNTKLLGAVVVGAAWAVHGVTIPVTCVLCTKVEAAHDIAIPVACVQRWCSVPELSKPAWRCAATTEDRRRSGGKVRGEVCRSVAAAGERECACIMFE